MNFKKTFTLFWAVAIFTLLYVFIIKYLYQGNNSLLNFISSVLGTLTLILNTYLEYLYRNLPSNSKSENKVSRILCILVTLVTWIVIIIS